MPVGGYDSRWADGQGGGGYANWACADPLNADHYLVVGDVWGPRESLDGGNLWHGCGRGLKGGTAVWPNGRSCMISKRAATSGLGFLLLGSAHGSDGGGGFYATPMGTGDIHVIDGVNGPGQSGYGGTGPGSGPNGEAIRPNGQLIESIVVGGTEYLFTITTTGIHRYTNGGATWADIGSHVNLVPAGSLPGLYYALSLCFIDDNHLYVGLWDHNAAGAVIPSKVFLVTSSAANLGVATTGQITVTNETPATPKGHIYHAKKGNAGTFLVGGGYDGGYKFTLSGGHLIWTALPLAGPSSDVLVASIDETSTGTIWVGQAGGSVGGTDYSNVSNGTPAGHAVIKGTLGGGNYTYSFPAAGGTVHGAIFKPGDGATATGPVWFLYATGPALHTTAADVICVIVDPNDDNKVTFTGRSGSWQTRNDGTSFYPAMQGQAGTEVRSGLHQTGAHSVIAGIADFTALDTTDDWATATRGTSVPVGGGVSLAASGTTTFVGQDGATYKFTQATVSTPLKITRDGVQISDPESEASLIAANSACGSASGILSIGQNGGGVYVLEPAVAPPPPPPPGPPLLFAPDDGIPHRSLSGQLSAALPASAALILPDGTSIAATGKQIALVIASMYEFSSYNVGPDKLSGHAAEMLDPAQTTVIGGLTYAGRPGHIISKYDKGYVEQAVADAPVSMRVSPNKTAFGGRNIMQPGRVVAPVDGWDRWDTWHAHQRTKPQLDGVNALYPTDPYRSAWFDTMGPESLQGQKWWAGNPLGRAAGTVISATDWNTLGGTMLEAMRSVLSTSVYIAVNGVRGGGTANQFAALASHADQAMWEGWTDYGIRTNLADRMTDSQFVGAVNAALAVQQKGCNFEGLLYLPGTTVKAGGAALRKAQEYETAVAMLASNDSNGAGLMMQMAIGASDPWMTGELLNPLYLSFRVGGTPTGASRLGLPLAHTWDVKTYRVASIATDGHLYQRPYTNGYLLLNTSSVPLPSSMDGRSYADLFTGHVEGTGVLVQPGQARFLITAAEPPPPPAPPVVVITSPPATVTAASQTLTATVTADAGLSTVEYQIGGGGYAPLPQLIGSTYQIPVTLPFVAGSTVVTEVDVRATDLLDQVTVTTLEVAVSVPFPGGGGGGVGGGACGDGSTSAIGLIAPPSGDTFIQDRLGFTAIRLSSYRNTSRTEDAGYGRISDAGSVLSDDGAGFNGLFDTQVAANFAAALDTTQDIRVGDVGLLPGAEYRVFYSYRWVPGTSSDPRLGLAVNGGLPFENSDIAGRDALADLSAEDRYGISQWESNSGSEAALFSSVDDVFTIRAYHVSGTGSLQLDAVYFLQLTAQNEFYAGQSAPVARECVAGGVYDITCEVADQSTYGQSGGIAVHVTEEQQHTDSPQDTDEQTLANYPDHTQLDTGELRRVVVLVRNVAAGPSRASMSDGSLPTDPVTVAGESWQFVDLGSVVVNDDLTTGLMLWTPTVSPDGVIHWDAMFLIPDIGLSCSAATETTIDLSWTPIKNANYVISIGGMDVATADPGQTSLTLTGLVASTNYDITITAVFASVAMACTTITCSTVVPGGGGGPGEGGSGGAPGFLFLCGTEIVNNARTLDYLRAGLGSGEASYEIGHGCDCSILYRLSGTPVTFTSPALDPAPWHDANDPDSDSFLGFLLDPADLQGLDSTVSRAVYERAGGIQGAATGPQKLLGRRLRLKLTLVADDCCGLSYGMRWLTQQVAASNCDGCETCIAQIRVCCPAEDGSNDAEGLWLAYDVALVDGPHPDYSAGIEPDCCDMRQVTLELVAGNPYFYELPTICIDPTAIAGLDVASGCIPFDEWFCSGSPSDNLCCTVTPPQVGTLGAIVTVSAPSGADAIEVASFATCPPNPSDWDDTTGTWRTKMTVSNLEAGSSLIIDSARHQILYVAPDGSVLDGTSRLILPPDRAFRWIEIADCDVAHCVCVRGARLCGYASGDVTISVETQLRVLAVQAV